MLTRRSLLKAKFSPSQETVRLPWVRDELEFTEQCTRCYDCISACEEKIIIKGDGGFPEINFNKGECTFCTECTHACSEDFFLPLEGNPWTLKAKISELCLTSQKVVCIVCREQCETEAISFIPKLGGVSQPVLDIEKCTGCGACAKPCPTNAIKFNYINEIENQ